MQLGLALRGVATAAIDISDGLLGDLSHVLHASRVGARIQAPDALNLIATNQDQIYIKDIIQPNNLLDFILAGGDDYELAFTAPAEKHAAVMAASASSDTRVTRIGCITATSGVQLLDATGQDLPNQYASFDHFA